MAFVSLILYGSFLFVQNFKHKAHYLAKDVLDDQVAKPARKSVIASSVILHRSLVAAVMLADSMAPDLNSFIAHIGAPVALSGIITACVVLYCLRVF